MAIWFIAVALVLTVLALFLVCKAQDKLNRTKAAAIAAAFNMTITGGDFNVQFDFAYQ